MPLVCTIELSKTAGVTITVENADDKITQTIVMNGTSIVTTVKGEEETSKITQLDASIKIEVKDFILEAETITCKSTLATSHTSEDTFLIDSTKDCTIKSAAKLIEKATGDITVTGGAKIDVEATGDATVKGANFTAEGVTAAELKGPAVTVDGATTVDVKGAAITVKGSASAKVDSPMTTVKGAMEKLEGSMIMIG